MRIIRRPSVYVVGRQQVDSAAIDRFLGDHGVASWSTDTEVAGEMLAEVAGRVCYMSFAKPRPGGNSKYLSHIREVGHGSVLEHAVWNLLITGVSRSFTHELVRHRAGFGFCLAGDTLVYSDHRGGGVRQGVKKRSIERLFEMSLTPHGRSRLRLLRPRSLDETTGQFTNGRVRRVVRSGIKPVFRVELEDGKSITCTREHRFLTPTGWQSLEDIAGGIRVSKGGLAAWANHEACLMVNGIAPYKDCAWLSEQYCTRNLDQKTIASMAGVSPHTIRAWVRKHGLVKPLGSWTVGREPWNKNRRYRPGWRHSASTRARLSAQKQGSMNPRWKGGITRQAIRIRRPVNGLRKELLERDGYCCRLCNVRGGRLTIHHVLPIWLRPDLAADVTNMVCLCRKCHLKVNGHELEYVERFGGTIIPSQVETRAPRRGRGRALIPRPRRIRTIAFLGEQMTYDLEMEGPHHNFVANGIVTHNSQLSQRYVDESVAEFVEPDCIGDDAELHEIFRASVEQSQQAYIRLTEGLARKFADVADATLRRKMARQAARSVLPNATETKIFVTANARALRHFIELRCNEHAETEIRIVAGMVLELLQKEAPNLFGDYGWVDLPDGTRAAQTEHRKV